MGEQNPEQFSDQEPTTPEVIEVMRNLAIQGRIDFTDEDINHVSVMPPEEAIGYLMFALAEAGEDPETFLLESGLISEE